MRNDFYYRHKRSARVRVVARAETFYVADRYISVKSRVFQYDFLQGEGRNVVERGGEFKEFRTFLFRHHYQRGIVYAQSFRKVVENIYKVVIGKAAADYYKVTKAKLRKPARRIADILYRRTDGRALA